MTAMRPDPDSDMAAQTEYGDDTGFAAEATRTSEGGSPEATQADTDTDAGAGDAAEETDQAVWEDGPGAGGD